MGNKLTDDAMDKMPSETKKVFDKYYAESFAGFLKRMETVKKFSPDCVAEAVLTAVSVKSPEIRYLPDPQSRFQVPLAEWFPEWLKFKIIARATKS
jgi:hypothetical protein